MPKLSNIVDYFKSCYQADFKAINILNFFGKKIEQQLVLESAELLNGKLIQYPVDSFWGLEMEKTLALHSQEKALFCCSFFLSGKMNVIGRSQKVFAPLYIHPVTLLHEGDVFYLILDAENAVINPVFVDFINAQSPDTNISYDELDESLPKGFIRFDEMHQIETSLHQLIPNLDLSGITDFPKTLSKEGLNTAFKKRNKEDSFSLHSGIAVGLIQKPNGSRGIINELEKMAQENDFSKSISALFSNSIANGSKSKPPNIISPVTLSSSQRQVFQSFEEHPLSLVIGPPGTGKSFTISALAVHLATQGKSVLIASKNNQAGRVITNKIENTFGLKGATVKTFSTAYKRILYRRLHDICYGLNIKAIDRKLVLSLETEINTLNKSIAKTENTILKRVKSEMKWGAFFEKYNHGFFEKYQKSWIEFQLNFNQSVPQLITNLHNLYLKRHKKTRAYIRDKFNFQLYVTLRKERQELQTLLEALKSKTGNLMQEHFDKINFSAVLHALPIWVANSSEIHTVLPLTKELFDVVIIDEATQCDIASSLPLLQRAKKAVIVGDPKQLRHISFLSRSQQQQLARKHKIETVANSKIDYRKTSLLDLASSAIPNQDQVCFLDEHYRSLPDIIDFSNQYFYSNQLKVMTATPITLKEKNVFLHEVNGLRNKKGQNEKEAEALIKLVKTIIEKEENLNKSICQSIGILSPFRAQVTLIKSMIREQVDTRQMKRHQILIGTPHQFQGEERDVMLLSFAVDQQSHPSTFVYLNKPDVFNVSITRARALQYIFTSVDLKQINPKYLVTQFLHQAAAKTKSDLDVSNYSEEDAFLEDVVQNLERWKVGQILKSYPIAGIEIDLVVMHKKQTYCIDLIGYPGEYADVLQLEQWKMLERIGVKTFALTYSSWYIDKTRSRNALRKFIFPKGLK